MPIRPVQWQLPQLSAEQIALEARVRTLLPSADLRAASMAAVRQTVIRYLGPEALLFAEGVSSTTYGTVLEQQGDQMVLLVLGTPPQNERVYLQIDRDVAGLMVDRLLGGRGDVADMMVPLTEAEQGVVQFLIMNVAAALHGVMGVQAPWFVRFERLIARRGPAEQLLPPQTALVQAAYRVGIGERCGTLRVLLPPATVLALSAATDQTLDAVRAEEALRFGQESVVLHADIGSCDLQSGDLASLSPGDIVLLDRCSVVLKGGAVTGHAVLRTGRGEHGGVRCALQADGHWQCRVEATVA